jgi:hypothetical protein
MPPAVERLAVEIQVGIDVDRAIDATNAEYRQVASVACVRAAVADVLDAGCPDLAPKGYKYSMPWLFFVDESEEQTELRGRFIDAVCACITTLQSPPHNMDAGLLARLARGKERRNG